MMVYYGWVEKDIDENVIYPFLQGALKNMPNNAPLRGPREFKDKMFQYTNHRQGSIKRFNGIEKITQNGKEIYRAYCVRGLIDQRR